MTAKKTKKVSPKKKSTRASKQPRRARDILYETDSTYFLKLVVVVILGTLWLKFATPVAWLGLPVSALPVGLLVGVLVVKFFEKEQADRKIWYAVLIIIGLISYFVPAGIVV